MNLFSETQSFLGNALVRWSLAITVVCVVGLVAMATVAEDAPYDALIGTAVSMLFVTALVARMGIVTEVAPSGLRVRLWPVPFKTYAWSEIASADVRTYRPLRDYGGWGLRWGPKGKAYNAHGTQGVQLVLRSGKRVLVGSQRAAELAALIRARI